MKNNLFNYATSELSQDAFICWWVSHINRKDDSPLYKSAKLFLDKIFQDQNIREYDGVKIKKQFKGIDVLLIVDDKYVAIIEDKTFTSESKNQINGYKEKILNLKGYDEIPSDLSEENLVCVYYTIAEQPESHYKSTYNNIKRLDIFLLLEKYRDQIQSDIYLDYYAYLKDLDDRSNQYVKIEIEKWDDAPYRGFFSYLEKEGIMSNIGGWGYIPNRSGGFMGLWQDNNVGISQKCFNMGLRPYLQIEKNKICVKGEILENKGKISKQSRDRIVLFFQGECQKEGIGFESKAFRYGKTITIGYIEYNYLNHIERIQIMENALKKFVLDI